MSSLRDLRVRGRTILAADAPRRVGDRLRDLDDKVASVPSGVRLGVLVAVIGILLDQATKEIAEALLRPGEFVAWLGPSIGWQLVYNPGGAFGLPLPPWVFLMVTVLVVIIVARTLPGATSLLQATSYGLLLAGALGNVIDRLVRPGDPGLLGGHVVDFIAWGWWPRFNVADSAISVGFVLLVVALAREELSGRRRRRGFDDAEQDG